MEITKLHDLGPVDLRSGQNGEYHREVRSPGDDLSDLPSDVQAAINAHWTPERVAAWQEANAPEPAPPPAKRDVNHERDRRIQVIIGAESVDEAIRAVMRGAREASRMMNKELRKGQSLSAAEQARATELESLDTTIVAIEDAATALKATAGGIPADFADDKHWPV